MLYLAALNSFERQRDEFKSAPAPPAFGGWSLALTPPIGQSLKKSHC